MITLRRRGGGPMIAAISAADFILCLKWLPSDSTVSGLPPQILKPCLGGDRDRLRIPQRRVTPQFDILHHAMDTLIERNGGLPAEIALNFADVRPGAVRLSRTFRNIDDRTAEKLDQTIDALGVAGAEVPDLAGAIGFSGLQEGRGDVGDEQKVAPLRAIADHREWLSGELLFEEYAEYRAVSA